MAPTAFRPGTLILISSFLFPYQPGLSLSEISVAQFPRGDGLPPSELTAGMNGASGGPRALDTMTGTSKWGDQ